MLNQLSHQISELCKKKKKIFLNDKNQVACWSYYSWQKGGLSEWWKKLVRRDGLGHSACWAPAQRWVCHWAAMETGEESGEMLLMALVVWAAHCPAGGEFITREEMVSAFSCYLREEDSSQPRLQQRQGRKAVLCLSFNPGQFSGFCTATEGTIRSLASLYFVL